MRARARDSAIVGYEADKKDVGVWRPPTASLLPIVAERIRRFRLKGSYINFTLCFVTKEEAKTRIHYS
jgi:hypothetical protein